MLVLKSSVTGCQCCDCSGFGCGVGPVVMSKERAKRRAAQEALQAEQRREKLLAQEAQARQRARRQRRELAWRRVRLWQHGPNAHQHRESWVLIGTVVFAVLGVTYLFTESIPDVLVLALIGILVAPLVLVFSFGRRR